MKRFTMLLGLLGLLGVLFLHSPAAAAPAGGPRVLYMTSSTLYLDGGSERGIREGDRFEAVRDREVIAKLEVLGVSSSRSVCAILEASGAIEIGDEVRALARGGTRRPPVDLETEDEKENEDQAGRSREETGLRAWGVRGRVALRSLAVDDQSGTGQDFVQPALTFKMQGDRVLSSDWGVDMDVRARRTYRDLADGSSPASSRTRVYRLEASWKMEGSPWRVSAGRQLSPSLAAVSVFDGLLAQYGGRRWSAGVFAGTQPDPVDYGHSNLVREGGGFVQYETRHGRTRWSVTSGAVGSYEGGELNREYFFLQGRYYDTRYSLSLSQELDLNRGWKADAGETALSPTNSFAFGRYAVAGGTVLEGGFDNRRRIRLYRDRVTPETDFDDSYRQGVWTGITQEVGDLRLSLRGRSGSGGIRSYSLRNRWQAPRVRGLRLGSRHTRFENSGSEGWLHSGDMDVSLGSRVRLELSRGIRRESDIETGEAENLDWTSVDLDVGLAGGWFFTLSVEESRGASERNRNYQSSASYRF
ncbi:MAG: hypothetical protein ABIK65_07805 [Candidatus Eisenbacteria bacterium]